MEFRTKIEIDKPQFQIEPCEEILFVGSCFADAIGRRFSDEGFPATYPQTAYLDALQAYFVTENEGEVGSQIDVATAINGIEIMRQKELPRAVYHINGQQIKHASHDINALPKGIYIIDGKKVVRK